VEFWRSGRKAGHDGNGQEGEPAGMAGRQPDMGELFTGVHVYDIRAGMGNASSHGVNFKIGRVSARTRKGQGRKAFTRSFHCCCNNGGKI
jgi:hypothetical protein